MGKFHRFHLQYIPPWGAGPQSPTFQSYCLCVCIYMTIYRLIMSIGITGTGGREDSSSPSYIFLESKEGQAKHSADFSKPRIAEMWSVQRWSNLYAPSLEFVAWGWVGGRGIIVTMTHNFVVENSVFVPTLLLLQLLFIIASQHNYLFRRFKLVITHTVIAKIFL